MHKMYFDNPTFKHGLNFTVRMGQKWSTQLFVGDFFEIDGFNGVAKVKRVFQCRVGECESLGVLQNYHAPDGRTDEGIILCMRRSYPSELKDKEDSDVRLWSVTCIGFVLYELC